MELLVQIELTKKVEKEKKDDLPVFDEKEKQILEEIKRDDNMYEIELEHDIYSVGVLTFLRSNSPKKLEQIVFKCIWTFVIQMILLAALIYGFVVDSVPTGGTKWMGIH